VGPAEGARNLIEKVQLAPAARGEAQVVALVEKPAGAVEAVKVRGPFPAFIKCKRLRRAGGSNLLRTELNNRRHQSWSWNRYAVAEEVRGEGGASRGVGSDRQGSRAWSDGRGRKDHGVETRRPASEERCSVGAVVGLRKVTGQCGAGDMCT
jgi:hypothetical protein